MDDLLGHATAEAVPLSWLIVRIGDRSFGISNNSLGDPRSASRHIGLSRRAAQGSAFQMIMARPGPVLPRYIATRRIKTRRLVRMIGRVVPVLRYLERVIHPRWPTPFEATKRVVGGVVLLLGVSLLVPIPLSNVPSALLMVLIAFAYLEEDGLLLCAALVAVLILFTVVATAIWETMSATGLL